MIYMCCCMCDCTLNWFCINLTLLENSGEWEDVDFCASCSLISQKHFTPCRWSVKQINKPNPLGPLLFPYRIVLLPGWTPWCLTIKTSWRLESSSCPHGHLFLVLSGFENVEITLLGYVFAHFGNCVTFRLLCVEFKHVLTKLLRASTKWHISCTTFLSQMTKASCWTPWEPSRGTPMWTVLQGFSFVSPTSDPILSITLHLIRCLLSKCYI